MTFGNESSERAVEVTGTHATLDARSGARPSMAATARASRQVRPITLGKAVQAATQRLKRSAGVMESVLAALAREPGARYHCRASHPFVTDHVAWVEPNDSANTPWHRVSDHPGAHGGRAGQRAGCRGLQRRRPGLASCAMLDVDGIRTELAAIRAQTDRPFNVNFFCHTEPKPDAERDLIWRVSLAPYFTEYGLDAERHSGRARPIAIQRRDGRRARRVQARSSELPLRPAIK